MRFNAHDKGQWIDVTSLNYFKAFDTVSHLKLLYKFQQYGFSDKMCAWMKTFLQNRKQCVKNGEELSSWSNVISGVPERSVCGPILYNIYVNDLPLAAKFCKIVMYADEVRLHITGDIPNANESMMIDLTNISQ